MPVIAERVSVAVKKILLATDFSEASAKAAAYAKALSRHFSSTVEVTYVFNPSQAVNYDDALLEFPPDQKRRISSEALEEIEKDLLVAGIPAHAMWIEGHRPYAAILRAAQERDVDLIVAGTSSKLGVDRLVLGSTAEELIRNAECPVLTVGPKAKDPGDGPLVFRSIVYATDFSAEAARAATFALSFAQDSGAHLYYCYVLGRNPERYGIREALDKGFESALRRLIPESSYDWCSPECAVEHGDAGEAILDLADRVDADLIVLGARKASFWLTHIERGLTPSLLAHARCPVMTVCSAVDLGFGALICGY
jgi:nucleotide-binding universal stress UspA family protein